MITSQKQLLDAKEKVKILKESIIIEKKKNIPDKLKKAEIIFFVDCLAHHHLE